MTALDGSPTSFEMTEWPEDRDLVVTDFCDLLEELTGRDQDPNTVHDNLNRVLNSPTSHLLVIERAGRIASTLTVNTYPILTGEGSRSWIDDVATLPEAKRNGLSKQLMTTGEALAAPSGEVYLTSKPDRGVARSFYENRGYELLNEAAAPLVVFRSTTVGRGQNPHEGSIYIEELNSNFQETDVNDLSRLLGIEECILMQRMVAVANSPTTKTFVVRALNGELIGVATGNETPIPVGKKPWIDDIAGVDDEAKQMATTAAGYWLGSGYKHVNIVAPPDTGYSEYVIRETGLYGKHLGRIATA